MKKVKTITLLTLALWTQGAMTCIELPYPKKTKMKKVFSAPLTQNKVTKQFFYDRIQQFQNFWSPLLFEKTQKTLTVQVDHESSKTKIYTTRDMDDNPIIVISENITDHSDITPDAIDFVLCHELGHHLGGAPKKMRGRGQWAKVDWSSVEGQADYFASLKCLPRYYALSVKEKENDKANTGFYAHYSKEDIGKIKTLCREPVCERIILAGLSFSRFYSTLREDWPRPVPGVFTNYRVGQTLSKHPEPQCRLETVVAGTRCFNFYDFDHEDPRVGACMEGSGKRPVCWFVY